MYYKIYVFEKIVNEKRKSAVLVAREKNSGEPISATLHCEGDVVIRGDLNGIEKLFQEINKRGYVCVRIETLP